MLTSILKETNPEYSLEELMLKVQPQYFGHWMQRVDSFEKTLMLRKTEGRRRRGQQRTRWLDGITDSNTWIWANSGRWCRIGKPSVLQSMGSRRVREGLAAYRQQTPIDTWTKGLTWVSVASRVGTHSEASRAACENVILGGWGDITEQAQLLSGPGRERSGFLPTNFPGPGRVRSGFLPAVFLGNLHSVVTWPPWYTQPDSVNGYLLVTSLLSASGLRAMY